MCCNAYEMSVSWGGGRMPWVLRLGPGVIGWPYMCLFKTQKVDCERGAVSTVYQQIILMQMDLVSLHAVRQTNPKQRS